MIMRLETLEAVPLFGHIGPGGEKMPSLRRIFLDYNGFSDECVDELLEVFGEKISPMEENDNEADFDDGLIISVGESDEDDDDEVDEDVDDVGHADDADIDALTAQVQGATLDHDLL